MYQGNVFILLQAFTGWCAGGGGRLPSSHGSHGHRQSLVRSLATGDQPIVRWPITGNYILNGPTGWLWTFPRRRRGPPKRRQTIPHIQVNSDWTRLISGGFHCVEPFLFLWVGISALWRRRERRLYSQSKLELSFHLGVSVTTWWVTKFLNENGMTWSVNSYFIEFRIRRKRKVKR